MARYVIFDNIMIAYHGEVSYIDTATNPLRDKRYNWRQTS